MSLRALLEVGAKDRDALSGPGRLPASYSELRAQVDRTVSTLNRLGVGRGDRVAVVLENGAEMASALLGIGSAASVAPLNPAYKRAELEFFMSDLEAKVLVFERSTESPSVEVARELGLGLIELVSHRDGPAGSFDLIVHETPTSENGMLGHGAPADVALLLHTSGTTSRPKIVPLTHANLVASAGNILSALNLGPEDLCLNAMPLFHIHGFMAGVVSSLAAGASTFITPGFNAFRFFKWLEEARPTWYSVVPSMHQAILNRAEEHASVMESLPLRLIRSSSSPLPPIVFDKMEQVFSVPVIESYGMTEASHQISSNPLPPQPRKKGTVGLPVGTEAAILSAEGSILPIHIEGEIGIRGENVMAGYGGVTSSDSFSNGWLRTGDQGLIDDDGYLRITGRLKEFINRGGEKVSPFEIDNVLLEHESVEQAVTFALPHSLLGQEVAAAVVPRAGATVTEQELRDHMSKRLAAFKVPKTIVIVDEIPKGPTGKPQRIGLADRLGLE